MPPRLSLRPLASRNTSLRGVTASVTTTPTPSVCLFCSLAPRSIPRRTTRRKSLPTRRSQSTTTTSTTATRTSENARKELQEALTELQKQASTYVNLSRVHLALNALRQHPGDETVRVAILGLSNGTESGRTAKEVLRLLLADPLSPEQAWEKELAAHDASSPLIVRIGATAAQQQGGGAGGKTAEEGNLTYAKGGLLKEMNVSSPGLNGHRLEILLMESNPLADASEGGAAFQGFEEAALVPTVEIPMSSTGRYTPVTTPVHKALLVTDGFHGAASLMGLPLLAHNQTIAAVVNLRGGCHQPEDGGGALPFVAIDADMARRGVEALRESPERAFDYQQMWYESNIPAIMDWLKAGATTMDNGTTKDAVRNLVASVLRNTLVAIQEEESRRLSSALSAQMSPTAAVASLNKALAEWSEKAHAELQGEMDRAFDSRRWSKLNWWKLFWRVDDVGVLSSEMLSTRFLPRAERNVIYLAGQVEGSGLFGPENGKTVYSLPAILSSASTKSSPQLHPDATAAAVSTKQLAPGTKWPTHITFTRNYLQSETVPALQALAQKLVLQAASFSTLTSGLGALMYLSSFGISESGAVAALGIVWSLRRVQTKWEAARAYWQSEVREEGRKAVRAVEISVADALDEAVSKSGGQSGGHAALSGELKTARELVHKAEEALERMK